ncbi:aminodeoxychorismate synthase component I [Geobacter argillaceus]|uniref:Para-aminobenzoate synthetase/4-amino-4-deoxychorismate lyase n=1 Tax=Geobacter argillaceus TaxID=345631 RepID=A0A562WQ42_9BACT|nr:aminodeoxychorismate synthase component I [Geobacter argillaceus]TWJ32450.1 para-aminobenzoate synthetase/4-amino-4-deoxychorismate lyase [Geobacter argillaceus]
MPEPAPTVLLDAFGPGGFGRSWRFGGHTGTLETDDPDRVAGVLAAVEQAAARGEHAVGFVSYEAAHGLNRDLPELPTATGMPLAWFACYRERVPCTAGEGLPAATEETIPLTPSLDPEQYETAVERVRSLIAAGDCYQANYTFPLAGSFHGAPLGLYQRICQGQQAPFCALLDTGRFLLLSASPELFFALRDGVVATRPMKGTAPRGRWQAEDREAADRLRQSPKERAENLMIVDLLRNDLGIVAETGSVRVASLFDLESYPTVHQMTSTVTARLRQGVGLVELFRALFPCGSVTGAPKRRAMEIIRDLETTPRGPYCGAIGYVSPGGEALFSVAIRTLVLDRESNGLTLGVGSGITWDAAPAAEYRECLTKGDFLGQPASPFRLIETLRLEGGEYTLVKRHLARMKASAARFGFSFDDAATRQLLATHAGTVGGCRKVRLLLERDGGLEVSSEPLAVDDPAVALKVALAGERLPSTDLFRFHKTTRRDSFERARSAHPETGEVLFLNERGELTEGSYHNLVLKLGGRLVTPPLTSGLLPGTLREELLERGEIAEEILHPHHLEQAEELWLINSVRGWRRGLLVDKRE